MTLQYRACSPCLSATLLWEQAAWQARKACPAGPWDFSVTSLRDCPLATEFTQHPTYGSCMHQGPLFSSQVRWSHIAPDTFHQWALGDSFPSVGFTSGDGTGLKKAEGRLPPSLPWWSSCRPAQAVTDPARRDMNKHCYSVSMVLCAEPSSLERIRLKHLDARLFHTRAGCTAMARYLTLLSCHPTVCTDCERTKILRNPDIHPCI